MASKKFLRDLFRSHLSNLRSIDPEIEDVYVCPICFDDYKMEDIESGILTDGHVWPEYIRNKSQIASRQRVLLCRKCNTKAGSRGDKQMQLAEKVKAGEKNGDLFGERRIELVSEIDENPIELRASVQEKDGKSVALTWHYKRTNPKEMSRFEKLVEQKQKFSFIIHPHNELRDSLPQAGWITSAYLLAFYSLGYRYIFHKSITPIREYIQKSFEMENKEMYLQLKSDTFGVMEYHEKVFSDPEIILLIPVDEKTPVHLEINFLKYQISLPFHFVPDIPLQMIFSAIPDFNDKMASIKEKGDYLFLNIDCSKLGPLDDVFEYLMNHSIVSPPKVAADPASCLGGTRRDLPSLVRIKAASGAEPPSPLCPC